MGYKISTSKFKELFSVLKENYSIYAPKIFVGDGTFANTDTIRYSQITDYTEIEFSMKSDYSFKEVLLPISQTLYYFTEDNVEAPALRPKDSIVFLRSCDLHALKRLDTIYLENGPEDSYYKALREHTKFILIGCETSFENCFCVSMETQNSNDYDAYFKISDHHVFVSSHWPLVDSFLENETSCDVHPDSVTDNEMKVRIPKTFSPSLNDSSFWEDYGQRCITCGRCNFVCPTCTCFTMEDIFYSDNGNIGERRRVWASCHVDGFTDVAGGHSFRDEKGQRMRFKVMHKIKDYNERFGSQMCIGCGRCDDVCPEYISFSNCINRLNDLNTEVK
ncbi:MAG: anaerobic sulfite reductase subunit AsrA [Eubacteriaceae bacterium]